MRISNIKFRFCFIIAGLMPFCASAQNNKIIIWNNDYKLKWEDFQGEGGDTAETIGASTNSSIDFSFNPQSNNILIVYIKSVFYKEMSMKNEGYLKRDSSIAKQALLHEQMHFDITELFARRLREEVFSLILKAKKKDSDWLINKINALQNKTQNECNKMQDQFDRENAYSKVPDTMSWENEIKYIYTIQEKWRKYIDNELDKLSQFSNSEFTIPVKKNTVM
jgi:hypothetical protein